MPTAAALPNGATVRSLAAAAAAAVLGWAALRCLLRRRYKVHPTPSGVVVTGVSSGIGRHAAAALARKGYIVYGTVRREADGVALAEEYPHNFVPVLMDVAKPDEIRRAAEFVAGDLAHRRIELAALVNNAGVSGSQVVEATDIAAARAMFDVNYFGVVQVTQAFLPLLRASRGRVITVGSLAGVVVRPFSATYSATKFAIEAFADGLRREMLEHGVSVSLVQPGVVMSEMATRAFAAVPKVREELVATGLLEPYSALVAKKEASAKNYSPEVISRPEHSTTPAILHAVGARYPQTRYAVAGFGPVPGWLIALLVTFLPDRAQDAIVTRL